jgi:hypothetical protein
VLTRRQSALTGGGVDALLAMIDRHPQHLETIQSSRPYRHIWAERMVGWVLRL